MGWVYQLYMGCVQRGEIVYANTINLEMTPGDITTHVLTIHKKEVCSLRSLSLSHQIVYPEAREGSAPILCVSPRSTVRRSDRSSSSIREAPGTEGCGFPAHSHALFFYGCPAGPAILEGAVYVNEGKC